MTLSFGPARGWRAIIRPSRAIGVALPVALVLLLAVTLVLPGPAAPSPMAPLSFPAGGPAATAMENITQWRGIVLARPLFNASRRPVTTAVADSTVALPRLSAIIVIGGVRSAIFSADGQPPQIMREGGAIDGYRLDSIAPDQVDLTGPQGRLALRPQFEGAAPPPPPAPRTNPANGRRLDDDPI